MEGGGVQLSTASSQISRMPHTHWERGEGTRRGRHATWCRLRRGEIGQKEKRGGSGYRWGRRRARAHAEHMSGQPRIHSIFRLSLGRSE